LESYGNTDATYLNWVTISSASIGPGTIQGYQIATNTIPASAIISINSSQISGSVVAGWLAQLNLAQTAYATNGLMNSNSPVFGDLGGTNSTVANPVIAPLAVTQGKLALQSAAGSATAGAGQIVDNSITTKQLLNNNSAASTPLLTAAVDPANNITIPTKSIIGIPNNSSSTQNAVAGDVLGLAYNLTGYTPINRAILNLADPTSQTFPQVPIVNPASLAYTFVNPQGANSGSPFGRVLQRIETYDNTKYITSANLAATAGLPTYATTGLLPLTGLATSFTPLSATSTLMIEITVPMHFAAVNNTAGLFLFDTGTTGSSNAIVATAAAGNSASTSMQTVTLKYKYAPGATTAISFTVGVGIAGGTTNALTINSVDGTTTLFGGIAASIRIVEYV
jgi:hypothetical protein